MMVEVLDASRRLRGMFFAVEVLQGRGGPEMQTAMGIRRLGHRGAPPSVTHKIGIPVRSALMSSVAPKPTGRTLMVPLSSGLEMVGIKVLEGNWET